MMLSRVAVFLSAGVLAGCGGSVAKSPGPPRPRPVTVLELRETAPRDPNRKVGSVTSWKTEKFGFEVGGRIESVIEPGMDVLGPELVESESVTLPRTGTVLSRVDEARYQARLAAAKAALATAEAQVTAISQDIENVLPKQIDAAAANQTLAQQRFDQQRDLLARGATTQADYDKSSADLQVAIADKGRLDSTRLVKQAELSSAEARVAEAAETVTQAARDVDDTVLYAPFTGQVSDVLENVGSVVQPGQPVLELQMMDPIEVDVQVSAAEDARLLYSDVVNVSLPDNGEATPAMVYEKSTLADPSTRTFLVRLLMRNEKIIEGMPAEFNETDVRTRNIWAPFRQNSATGGTRYFINEDSIHRDEQGEPFVLRIKGIQREPGGRTPARIESTFDVERVKIVIGEERLSFLNVAVLRVVEDLGDIKEREDLFVGELRRMDGTPLNRTEADERARTLTRVHFVRERWRVRPGDTVDVDLSARTLPRGFYLPMDAIVLKASGDQSGFVVAVLDEGAGQVARRVPVRIVHEDAVAGLKRVVPVDAATLLDGSRIVLGGAHAVIDGEAVRISGRVEGASANGVTP